MIALKIRLSITEKNTKLKAVYSNKVKVLSKLKTAELCETTSKINRVSTRHDNTTYKKRTLTHMDLFLL
jgi:hypothetical protein